MPLTIVRPSAVDGAQLASVRLLIADIAREDGREPLSDQALTRLASVEVEHAVAIDGDRIVGYAQLDGPSLEIAAHDDAIGPLLDTFADRKALIWTHGEHSRLVEPLTRRHYVRARDLIQLRRRLSEPVRAPDPPHGIAIRAFVPGVDEQAWVRVNAAAFAHHPEQGSWTRADLEAREHAQWFDPAGFLLAWKGEDLVGFHWTKVHPDGVGEVYVLAVAPEAQGLHLGSVLLQHGLASLYERGCREVLLYVDGDNAAALQLYERYGFGRHDLDVQWRTDHSATGSESNT